MNPRVQTPERDVPSSDSGPLNDTDGLLGSVALSSEEGSLLRHGQSPSLAYTNGSARREELLSSKDTTNQALSPPNTSYDSQNSPENGSICTTDLPNVEYYADPPPERTWVYTKTYFDEAAEQSFGIVDQLWFEARLRKHLDGMASDDTGWFALRNAVWALGARLSISKTSSYSQALSKSWVFFEKALSVHTEIILFSSSLPAVQALALMAYYAEGASDINTPLFYPWSPPVGQKRPDPQLVSQIEASCGAVAGAARFTILATRQIHVDASCCALVSLFVPVYSFITQFIHVLRCDAAHAQSELDILDQQRNKPPKAIMDNSIQEASQYDIAIEDEIANIYDTADSSLLIEEANFEDWDSLLPSLATWDTAL
ncbi:hypothetical protein MY4824_009454 [Beauveria thailandica]